MPHVRPLYAHVFLLPAVFALFACSDQGAELLAPAGVPESSLSTTAPAGNPYFTFLEPLSAPASAGAMFDGSLAPVVTVAGVDGVVASFSSEGRGAGSVRVDGNDEQYVVNWRVPAGTAEGMYRITVSVDDRLLGYLDVEISERSRGHDVRPGSTVPIKFRIEEGALRVTLVPVGKEGGTVETADGSVTMIIPEGAVSGETPISVEALETAEDPDGRVVPGTAYEFGPDGTSFEKPVTLTLSYDAAALPAGTSERLLRLHTLVDGRWEQVPGSRVDPATGVITGEITHFSKYAGLPERFVEVAAGERHACGLTESGAAWCWGANSYDQLGALTNDTCEPEFGNPADCSLIAVEVQGGLVFESIEAGNTHTCGVSGGSIYCWGHNNMGQLGIGSTADQPEPTEVPMAQTFVEVTAEFYQSCGRTDLGEVWCWGRNSTNMLGQPTTDTCSLASGSSMPCSLSPVQVPIPAAVEADMGLAHACAVTDTGDLYCWGWNVFGQLGNGTATQMEDPTLIAGGPWVSTTAGALHSCAIDNAGDGYCWGTRGYATGALGTGTNDYSLSPAQVAGGLTFTEIDASPGNYIFTHTCAVASTSDAYCWGANRDGALGVETASSTCQLGSFDPYDCALEPMAVSGGLQFHNVSTGRGFTCGYATDGDIYCWGLNDTGQLGDDTVVGKRTPVKVQTYEP